MIPKVKLCPSSIKPEINLSGLQMAVLKALDKAFLMADYDAQEHIEVIEITDKLIIEIFWKYKFFNPKVLTKQNINNLIKTILKDFGFINVDGYKKIDRVTIESLIKQSNTKV